MDNPAKILAIRAGGSDHTYVGANFCPDEQELRDTAETINPLEVLSLNSIRRAVQAGMKPKEALTRARIDEESRAQVVFGPAILRCLNRIQAGGCAVYPLEEN